MAMYLKIGIQKYDWSGNLVIKAETKGRTFSLRSQHTSISSCC